MSDHLAVELLSGYLDSEVTPTELRLVEGHLNDCSECRRTVAGLRAVSEGVRRLEAVAPPATLARSVEHRVARASLEQASGFRLEESLRRWMAQPVLAPVFAIVLALGTILYLFAFGVARDESRGTRLVIASAPDEPASASLPEAAREDRVAPGPVEGAPAGAESARDAAEQKALEKAPSPPPPPAGSRLEGAVKASESAEAAEATGAPDAEPAEKAERLAIVESIEARTVPARVGAARDAESLVRRQLEASVDSETGEPEALREVAGRRFVSYGSTWVEAGLEGAAVDEVVDWRQDAEAEIAELEAFRELGRIRVRIDDRVVEVVYPESEQQER